MNQIDDTRDEIEAAVQRYVARRQAEPGFWPPYSAAEIEQIRLSFKRKLAVQTNEPTQPPERS